MKNLIHEFVNFKLCRKHFNSSAIIVVLIAILFGGCVNKMDDSIPNSSEPRLMTFSASVGPFVTRSSDTFFKTDDVLALFVSGRSSSTFEKIENVPLKMRKDYIFYPSTPLYYPASDEAFNVFSYYPFSRNVPSLDALPVKISASQENEKDKKESDFLVAVHKGIKASSGPIQLNFKHKLCKISLVIKVASNLIEKIFSSNPSVIAAGLPLNAVYSVHNDTFTKMGNYGSITPYGEWSIKDDCLIGKSMIVFPSEKENNDFYFTVAIDGNLYTCDFPKIPLVSSSQYEFIIDCTQMSENLIPGAVVDITDWNDSTQADFPCKQQLDGIPLSSLSFPSSYIYTVYSDSKPIYTICREYLRSPEIESVALVAYPLDKFGQMKLSSGTLLRLPDDNSSAVCGGSISWDSATDFTFTPGNRTSLDKVYIDSEGKLTYNKAENCKKVVLRAYCLNDFRANRLQSYPLVKIGTEIWMSEGLSAAHYTDGSPIPLLTELTGTEGYLQNQDYTSSYYYSGESILNGKLLPSGWCLPDTIMINDMFEYLGDNSVKLLFSPSSLGEKTTKPSLSGMDLELCGQFSDTRFLSFNRLSPCWYRIPGTNKLPEKLRICGIKPFTNKLYISTISLQNGKYKAFPVRAVKISGGEQL